MRKVLWSVLLLIVFIDSYSKEDLGIEYGGLKLNLDAHEATLATSEKLTPIYTEIKYNFNKYEKVSPFLKGDLGFAYVEDMEDTNKMRDMSDNTYYSMGAGVDIDYLTIELSYITYQVGYMKDEDNIDEERFVLRFKYSY